MARHALGLAPLVVLVLAGCATPASRPDAGAYSVPVDIDVTLLLGPPPTGPALERDLASVRAAQRERTPAEAAHAEATSTVELFQFSDVLGPAFKADQLPRTQAFFGRVYSSVLPYLQITKDCWSRPRPFQVDTSLAPLERSFTSTRSRGGSNAAAPKPLKPDSPCVTPPGPPEYSTSYPSGHAMLGAVHAILLARMVPEQRTALFAEGWDHGRGRLISGVHFPSDIESGRTLGTVLVALLEQDPAFRADLEASRREVRAVLGLR